MNNSSDLAISSNTETENLLEATKNFDNNVTGEMSMLVYKFSSCEEFKKFFNGLNLDSNVYIILPNFDNDEILTEILFEAVGPTGLELESVCEWNFRYGFEININFSNNSTIDGIDNLYNMTISDFNNLSINDFDILNLSYQLNEIATNSASYSFYYQNVECFKLCCDCSQTQCDETFFDSLAKKVLSNANYLFKEA